MSEAKVEEWSYKVCCIGAGYVGGPTMAVMAKFCPKVKIVVCDISQNQINRWNSDKLPVYEPGLDDVVTEVRGKNLFFTTDVDGAIQEADMIFVSVNTPTKAEGLGAGRAANLKNWESAARRIAKVARSPKVVVEKSTLPVRTAAAMQQVMLANEHGVHFEILSNPEFLAEGTAIPDLTGPDRVLIGGGNTASGKAAVERLVWLYSHWIPKERILTTNLWSSELSKLVANAFLAQRISSINSISALCEVTGADVQEVSRAIGMDRRIGANFLNASVGFGGSCFQKDILNLIYLCESFGLNDVAEYWNQVVKINDWQKRRFSNKIIGNMFGNIAGKKIALLGFAFKKDTADTRETPAVFVAKHLLQERPYIAIYDPKVEEDQIRSDFDEYKALPNGTKFDDLVTVCKDPYEAIKGSHALTIITEWTEFKTLDYERIYNLMEKPAYIFDGRNILDHKKLIKIGFRLYAIGKPYGSRATMDEAYYVAPEDLE